MRLDQVKWVPAAVCAAIALNACSGGGSSVAANRVSVSTSMKGVPTSTAATASGSALPAQPTRLSLLDLPGGVVEIRAQKVAPPDGQGTAYVKWYGRTLAAGPTFTSNITVGPEAGAWMRQADAFARDASAGAAEAAVPRDTTIAGYRAIEYVDAVGWASLSWSPRPDLLLSITGFHSSYADLEAAAEKAVVQ